MAKKSTTRTLSNAELSHFVSELGRQKQFTNYQQGVRAQQAQGAASAAPAGPTGGGDSPWDTTVRVGSRILNALGAGGSGAQQLNHDILGMLQETRPAVTEDGVDIPWDEYLGVAGRVLGGQGIASFAKGFGDAITGNDDELKYGFENIEKAADTVGHISDPNYVDKKDNVDPVAKGVGGFALDVVQDPLTFSPAGPGLAAAKGGVKASVAAARAAEGGDLAKTAAFFNPVTAAKGATKGATDWFKGAADGVKNLRTQSNPTVEAALDEIKAAPATKAAANIAEAAPARPAAVPATATVASEAVRNGVGEGARAAEATAMAAKAAEGSDWDQYWAKANAKATPEAAVPVRDPSAKAPDTFAVGDIVTRPRDSRYWKIEQGPEGLIAVTKGMKAPIPEAAFRSQRLSKSAIVQSEQQAAEEAAELTAERTIREQMAEQLAPDLARAAAAGANTTQILASLRALTYTANRYPARIEREIKKLGPVDRTDVQGWTQKATELLGDEDLAVKLRKIADPEQFGLAAREIGRARVTQALDGQTPTNMFRKLTSGRNEFDPAAVRQVANLLGLADVPTAGEWKDFSDFLRRADPKAAYTEMQRAEKLKRDLLSGTGLPGVGVALPMAKQINPDAARAASEAEAEALGNLISPELRAEYDEALASVFPADFKKKYRYTSTAKNGEKYHTLTEGFGDAAKPIAKYVYNQNTQLTHWKKLFEQAKGKFTNPRTRQDDIFEYITDGLKYTDARLRSYGISPVNGALGREKSLLKTRGDHAFLSFGDIIGAMPPETAKALLFGGKDINVTPTLFADTARQALRLAETDMDSAAQATTLLHQLQERLTKEFGGKNMTSIQKRLADPKNHMLLRGLAGAFTDPDTIRNLAAANARNLAFATAVNGKEAWRAVKPIAETLRAYAKDPNVSVGTQIDAILSARDEVNSMLRTLDIEDTPAAGLAESMLDKVSTETTSSAALKQARGALGQERAVVDGSGQPVTKTVKAERVEKANEAVAAAHAPGKDPTRPKGAPATENSKRAAKKTREGSNVARALENAGLHDTARELAEKLAQSADAVIDDPIIDFDAAHAAFTMGLPGWLRLTFKGAEKMDGWFGKSDTKVFAISAEMQSQAMSAKYTAALKAVEKTTTPETRLAAIRAFTQMGDNGALETAIADLAPDAQDAARKLWPVFSQVFDNSEHGALQRVGLDGEYLNGYLAREGVDKAFFLNGEQTWENGTSWRGWNWESTENPLDLINRYHRAIAKAQVVPDVAASFSSQFGSKSSMYGPPASAQEARDMGWAKPDVDSGRSGGLFYFLDKDQYYPREMLTQLSLMDDYYAASRTLDQDKFFDKTFRYADPVVNSLKASITLWRLGHHITNIMGEFLFNTLAGVYNPLRYSTAARIMAKGGQIDDRANKALESYMRQATPAGAQLKEGVQGVRTKIRGQDVYIGDQQMLDLLNQHGVTIQHHQAEDLLNEGFDVVGRSAGEGGPTLTKGPNKIQQGLQKINRTVAPGWLGKFSANRDNVFRIAHAVDILEKRSFNSLDEAMQAVTAEINKFHPNMHTLGAFEQKYVRRLIYFYTWQRQALTQVFTSMIDTPGRVMVAPKAIFNASAANGADPQSWGEPVADEGGIPDYLRGNFGQIMSREGLTQEDEGSAENYLWGYALNAPQLDILQSAVGSIATDPEKPLWEQAGDAAWQTTSRNLLQNLTPLAKIPIELGTHAQLGTGIPIQEGQESDYLWNQTGLRAPLVTTGLLEDENDDPTVQQLKRETAAFNWATGLRRTLYNGPEQYEIWKRQEQEKAREASSE